MNSSDVEKLLEPLSAESPCGPDLEYDAEFGEMERAAQSKAEQQFGDTIVSAEPPEWKAVRKKVDSLLERTKDMRVAVYLARCALNLEGLPSFELAIRLLRGYLETYWDSVHPELDHSDNDDPTYRTNTLITLCDEETLLRELREVALVSSRAMGQFGLRDIEHVREAAENPVEQPKDNWSSEEGQTQSEPSGPTMAAIEAAFSDVTIEDIQAVEEATRLSAEHIDAIEKYVTDQVGVAQAVSLEPIRSVLLEMHSFVKSQLERRGVYNDDESVEELDETTATGESTGEAIQAGVAVKQGFNGKVNSREEAIKALDSVCEFYERNEPSSPLPLLIRRAKRLASKSFLEILRDLAPDAVTQAEALGGGGEAEGAGESTESSSSW
jgi:type VI secretion system protein ImpA